MPTFHTVIPLLHRECRLFRYVPVIFDEKSSVRPIRAEHLGAIISKDRKLSEYISSRTKCILISSETEPPTYADIDQSITCGTFALNVFAKSGSISCGQAFVVRYSRSHSVVDVFSHSHRNEWSSEVFSLDTAAGPDSVKTLFASAKNALQKDKKLSLTIRRFNAALTKTTPEDKIVDLAISLESIFSSQTEISYKFSLFNSLISETIPSLRYNRYLLLKKLYQNRSDIVHGNKILSVDWFNSNWAECVKIAKLSLLGKIDFLSRNSPEDWQAHLDNLALGAVS